MRILLGQLGSNGDCLYATTIAHQLKNDYPSSHLTWAVAGRCRSVVRNNPHIDEIWEWDVPQWDPVAQSKAWNTFEVAAFRSISEGRYDRAVMSQVWPNNFRNFDGTVRSSVLRGYPGRITVPVDSTIVLDAGETGRVHDFARDCGLGDHPHRILFECEARSGQSHVTPEFALQVAEMVDQRLPGTRFVLSTHRRLATGLKNVVWADSLGIRENTALTHLCTLFVGCGSGLTVAATSSAAAEITNIQLLNDDTSVYASFFHDFEYFKKPSGRFIEMTGATPAQAADAIVTALKDGHDADRTRFHRPIAVTFEFYGMIIESYLLKKGRAWDALDSLSVTAQRYGLGDELRAFGRRKILPLLADDPFGWDRRREVRHQDLIEQLKIG